MSIPLLNINFSSNIKNVKKQKFHPRMLKVPYPQIFIIPFFEITIDLINEFNNNRYKILEIFTNKKILMEFIDFLNSKVIMPKDLTKRNINTLNNIKLLIKNIFEKDVILNILNKKFRIFDLQIIKVNDIPSNNIYNAEIKLQLVHDYKDKKSTDIKMTCKVRKKRIINLINETFNIKYDNNNINKIFKNKYYKYTKKQKKQKKG